MSARFSLHIFSKAEAKSSFFLDVKASLIETLAPTHVRPALLNQSLFSDFHGGWRVQKFGHEKMPRKYFPTMVQFSEQIGPGDLKFGFASLSKKVCPTFYCPLYPFPFLL